MMHPSGRRLWFACGLMVVSAVPAAPNPAKLSRAERQRIANDVLAPPPGQRNFQQGWQPGATIPVFFKNGKAARKTAVMHCANEWSKYGNFQFQWNTGPMRTGVHAIHIEF